VVWQATEATLYEVKLLIEDLPNNIFQANVNNLPTDYAREVTLNNVDATLNSFPTKVWDSNVVNFPQDYAKEITLSNLKQLLDNLPSEVLQANINNLPLDYSTESTLLALKQLVNDLPTKTLQASLNNLPTDYGTELTLQSLGAKLDAIQNFISTPTSLTLTNSLLVGVGSIDAGFVYMNMFVVQGPVVIGGKTYNTNDDIVLHPIPFKVYPAIAYNMAVGSVRFTGFK
jgi:hypothetical protein